VTPAASVMAQALPGRMFELTCQGLLAMAVIGAAVLAMGIRDLWRAARARQEAHPARSPGVRNRLARAMRWSGWCATAAGALFLGGPAWFVVAVRNRYAWRDEVLIASAIAAIACLVVAALWGSRAKRLRSQ